MVVNYESTFAKELSPNHIFNLHRPLKAGKFEAKIALKPFNKLMYSYKNTGAWGPELTSPKNFIYSLDVSIKSQQKWVRLSAFSDLFDINKAEIVERDKYIVIKIEGGETSYHYIAEIYFDREGYLVKRNVWSPSFPDQVKEETTYSFIRNKDM